MPMNSLNFPNETDALFPKTATRPALIIGFLVMLLLFAGIGG